jgi:hypothetical protein
MFIRIKRSVHDGATYEYLQVVRSYREGPKVRQQVVATLGRREALVASGQLDGLIRSLAKFSERLRVVEVVRRSGLAAHTAKAWGPALVFGRLWERQGLPAILASLAAERQFAFDVERAVFALALQRLMSPGSDLQGAGWLRTVEAPGFDALALQHLYRTTGFLAAVREDLERRLFERDRDLFTQHLDAVFIDTTSLYVYRDTETAWRKRGYSRDRRGDLPQFVLCVVVNDEGWPLAWEIFPGNTADAKAFRQVVGVLRERFSIRHTVVVADRGMMSQANRALLTEAAERPYDYVLGCHLRREKEVRDGVLGRLEPYECVDDGLEVQEVRVADRRYVVCRNPAEAARDAAAREALLAKLETTLTRQGPKALVSNRGYARFLKVDQGSVRVDREAVEREARLDGLFVLTTNTDLPTTEVVRTYKSLWRVERTFREEKSTLEVRPIYHHRDDTSMGHIVASFLALRLEVDLQRRLDERAVAVSWPDLMRDLAQVEAVEVELDGERYRLRTDVAGSASAAFAAAGVRPPATATPLGAVP